MSGTTATRRFGDRVLQQHYFTRAAAVVLSLVAVAPALVVGLASEVSAAPLPSPSAAPTKSAPPLTFGIGPSQLKGSKYFRPFFSYAATPGGRVTDSVIVLNGNATPIKLYLSAADGSNNTSGSFVLSSQRKAPVAVGKWIKVAKPVVVIPANGQVVVPFTMSIPSNATPGDHAGGVVATYSHVGLSSQGRNVVVDSGVGSRVFVRISGALRPRLSIVGLKATYHDTLNPLKRGYLTVSYRVKNTGNVRVLVDQLISVSGWFGAAANRTTLPTTGQILPGNSFTVTRTIKNVSGDGVLKVRVTATPRPVQLDADPPMHPVTATTTTTAFRVSIGAIGAVAVVLVAWLVLSLLKQSALFGKGAAAGAKKSAVLVGAGKNSAKGAKK